MSGAWNHLSRRWKESDPALADFIHRESMIQEKLESTGYSSPTWRVQRALQSIHGAEELYKSAFRGTSKMLVLLRVSESEGDSSFINKACHPWVTCWIRMRRISDLFL